MIADEPVRGVFTYREHSGILSLSGLAQARLFQRRELPYGPLWYLTGLELTEVGLGRATFRLPCTGWLQSPAGVVPGGVLAFATDAPLATAIATALGPRRVPTTSDLALNFIRPPDPDADGILVRSGLVHEGATQALSEATIEDSRGHLLARAATRCVLVDVPGPLPEAPQPPVAWPDYEGPHPFQRAPQGQVLAQEVWDELPGIEMLGRWQAGTLPRSPLSNLIGAALVHVEEGAVTCTMPATGWFCGMQGAFYGGALALLADYAIHGAVQSTQPAGNAWATLDLKVRYLRPVAPNGAPVKAAARVVHHGRLLAVVRAEILQGDGRPSVLADASVMLLPHRRWTDVARLTDEAHELGRTAPAE